ncbi:hypothetical protein BT63DRAFT_100615 [Microthyrium microscopicum]|uniref:(4-O-methyl)-D-glucuronate--lignin esterase n=1 Tax=Microthyrium microscopicum TaxID=703497 RepID=A0A6A6TXA5_9PEZI|nr:hypothetical protein BT63DRAFT_100615 [Microthyrium microscopicum]
MRVSSVAIFSAIGLVAAQDCAKIPETITYNKATLPDPFTTVGGAKVTTKAQWQCRRQEIIELLSRYELGPKPPKPANVSATFSGNSIKITITEAGKTITMSPSVRIPTGGSAPYPVIIAFGMPSIAIPAGVAVVNFQPEQLAPSDPPHGKGAFFNIYGSNHNAGGLMAWAWGVSRVIDAIEQIGAAAKLDPKRIGVTGCSRYGKGALASGAFDERISLTLPQEGGSGGPGCWRVVAEMKRNGTKVEDAVQISGGDQWFNPKFAQNAKNVNAWPEDHHMLMGLVAPRGLLVIENTGIDYLGPPSTAACTTAAKEIYKSLGAGDSIGYTASNHGHCSLPANQGPDIALFAQRFLFGKAETKTEMWKTDKKFDVKKWIDWATPTLT